MPDLVYLLGKSVRRFILPGISFVVFLLWIPLILFFPEILNLLKLSDPFILLALILVFGYLLDSMGTYRYTLNYLEYNKYKNELIASLKKIKSSIDSDDPDQFVTELWIKDRELYERLFLERAEWVMILEFSFCMLSSGIILIILIPLKYVKCHNFNWVAIIFGTLLFLCSVLCSKVGIKRMRAHDNKLITSLKYLDEIKKEKGKAQNV